MPTKKSGSSGQNFSMEIRVRSWQLHGHKDAIRIHNIIGKWSASFESEFGIERMSGFEGFASTGFETEAAVAAIFGFVDDVLEEG